MGENKILLGKYPSHPGKTKITKVNFLMIVVRFFKFDFKKNINMEPMSYFKNKPVQLVIVNPVLRLFASC
jgi:hypothetical protein